jgi:hypothetical protein
LPAGAQHPRIDVPDFSHDDFFQPTILWTAHVTFTAEQDEIRTAYLARMGEFTGTIFKANRFAAAMAAIVPVIRLAIAEEGTQWLPGFDDVASGQTGILPFVKARNENAIAQLGK